MKDIEEFLVHPNIEAIKIIAKYLRLLSVDVYIMMYDELKATKQ